MQSIRSLIEPMTSCSMLHMDKVIASKMGKSKTITNFYMLSLKFKACAGFKTGVYLK